MEQRGFLEQWKYSVWYCQYNDVHVIVHLSESIECTTSRVNPNVNFGLQMIMTCHCRFTLGNKCTTLVAYVDNGEAMHVWRRGIWEISVPSSPFCCESKTALKNKVFIEKEKKICNILSISPPLRVSSFLRV